MAESIGNMWIGPVPTWPPSHAEIERQERLAKALVDHVNRERNTMAVKLKFRVTERIERVSWNAKEGSLGGVKLGPVVDGSDENKAFFAATPSGQIEFSTINRAALDSLPIGAEVYVTIEVAGEK